MKQMRVLLASLSMLALLLNGCTKEKKASFQDEKEAASIVSISELTASGYKIEVTEPNGDMAKVAAQEASNKPSLANNEKPLVEVKNAKVPVILSKMIKSKLLSGKVGSTYPLLITVNKKYVNISKVVADASELTTLEQQLSSKQNGKIVVPVYKVAIAKYGVIAKQKSNGEATTNLELSATAFEDATHVQISTLPEDLLKIDTDENNKELLKEVHLIDKIDKKISQLSDLRSQLSLSNLGKDDGKVYSQLDKGNGVDAQLMIYRIVKLSSITDEALLRKIKANSDPSVIGMCSAEILAQLDLDDKEDCVAVLAYKVPVSYVKAKLDNSNSEGVASTSVKLESVDPSKTDVTLVRIEENQAVSPSSLELLRRLDPADALKISDLQGKEFFLRRTFEDAASSVTAFGPGASGEMELVKLDLEKDRLVVRRILAVNGVKAPNDLDREELMSFRAIYIGRPKNDQSLVPKYQIVAKEEAEFVEIDLNDNAIDSITSPLSFISDGQCFRSTDHSIVKDVDSRLKQGILSFSIESTQTFLPDCMSFYKMQDYWKQVGMQGTFNIRERISLRENKKENDQLITMDLPFRAQNLLGFGVFTMGKKEQDEFGSLLNTNTERAFPMVQASFFDKNKKMTYVLGGLPASGKIREALIDTTRKVLDDWNRTLKFAFRGTKLDRADGIYIDLQIDGVDVPYGHLGDLDRNYIWNYERNLDSSLLGMSQPAPNPRSGKVEANNVLMYSGNLLWYIGYEKEIASIQKEYSDLKAEAEQQARKELEERLAKEKADAEKAAAEWAAKLHTPVHVEGDTLIIGGSEAVASAAPNDGSVAKMSATAKASNIVALTKKYVAGIKTSADSEIDKATALAKLNDRAFLVKIMKKAMDMKAYTQPSLMEAITATEMLKAADTLSKEGYRISPAQKTALAANSRKLALKAEFEKKFNMGANCAFTAQMLFPGNTGELLELTTEEIFSKWYATTLAHEVGHSLGLTHNFMGNTDKENFRFDSESEDVNRNYSSIMDYIPGTHLNYNGPGPYDAHALRAAYAGRIELAIGLDVSLEQYKNATIGKNGSWWDLNANHLNQVMPPRHYSYCTDIHVGGNPLCQRFDVGTTAAEIAQYNIEQYQQAYPILNHIGNRFEIRGLDSYISRVFSSLLNLRINMDETYYQLINGGSRAAIDDNVDAAISSLKLLHNIINTPEADVDSEFYSLERFKAIEYQAAGANGAPPTNEIEVVESKSLKDQYRPGSGDEVIVRGIEFDKVIALLVLTQRGADHPRYDSIGLKVSFADFEKLLGLDTVDSTFTLSMLKSLVSDNMRPRIFAEKKYLALPLSNKLTVTEMMRSYGLLAAGIFLDADTIDRESNFSGLFQVGSNLDNSVKDRFVVSPLSSDLGDPKGVKLWAFKGAVVTNDLVRTAAQQRALVENAEKIAAQFTKVLEGDALSDDNIKEAAINKSISLIMGLNKGGLFINAAEIKDGANLDKEVDLFTRLLLEQRTFAVCRRHRCFYCRYGLAHMIVVPRILRLLGLLYLQQVEIMHVATVFADTPIFGKKVIDGRFLHFSHNGLGFVGPRRLDGVKIVHG